MPYPRASNFQSGLPFDAWWSYAEGGVVNVCATQGLSFVRSLQTALGVPATGIWDATLQNALVQQAASIDASQPNQGWTSVRTLLASDVTNRSVSRLAVMFGIYLMYYRPSARRFDAIGVQQNTALPLWDASPADDANNNGGRIVCFNPSQDTPPELLQTTALGKASQESTTGIRLGNIPVTTPIVSTQGLSKGATAGILAILGLVFLGLVMYSSSGSGNGAHSR